jgi:hypothetical protein
MPVCDENHRSVAVAAPVARGDLHEPLDLGLGQVFATSQVAIPAPSGCNCSFFGGWRDQPEV